jgi:hypothetical protein
MGLTKIGEQGSNDVHCGVFGLSLQSYRRWNMTILTVEGIVENGQIRLRDNVTLPENTKVYVVIPDVETVPPARIYSPRLVHPEQAPDFAKQVIEVASDAEL